MNDLLTVEKAELRARVVTPDLLIDLNTQVPFPVIYFGGPQGQWYHSACLLMHRHFANFIAAIPMLLPERDDLRAFVDGIPRQYGEGDTELRRWKRDHLVLAGHQHSRGCIIFWAQWVAGKVDYRAELAELAELSAQKDPIRNLRLVAGAEDRHQRAALTRALAEAGLDPTVYPTLQDTVDTAAQVAKVVHPSPMPMQASG